MTFTIYLALQKTQKLGLFIGLNKIGEGSIMQENDTSKTFSDNLLVLKDIQNRLKTIKNGPLKSINQNINSNDAVNKKENIESILCVKIKKKNIDKVNFGVNVNIGCDVLNDYLFNKKILNISLNFNLRNLSTEQNMVYFIHDINNKSLLTSFATKNSEQNKIDLNDNISLLQNKIESDSKLSFFIPIFQSYDNYDDFYDAIYDVTLDISYMEND